MDSPNLSSLDRWAFDVRRVDKPWGYELIWALTDVYCGKVLFVKAGHSLSLQFHREKDESWLVQSGRARVERPLVERVDVRRVEVPGHGFRSSHASHSGCEATWSPATRSSFGVFTVSQRPS